MRASPESLRAEEARVTTWARGWDRHGRTDGRTTGRYDRTLE
jgi:hypothetical protein